MWKKDSRKRVLPTIAFFLGSGWFVFLWFESWDRPQIVRTALMVAAIVALVAAVAGIASFYRAERKSL